VSYDQHSVTRSPFRKRVVSPLGNRLRSPLHELPPFEIGLEVRMQLEPLHHNVDVEVCLVIVEPDDHAHHDHSRTHRIHDSATERSVWKRPTKSVDDAVERALCLPEFFHSEREDLGVERLNVLPLLVGLRERSPSALGEHRDLRRKAGWFLIGSSRLAVTVETG